MSFLGQDPVRSKIIVDNKGLQQVRILNTSSFFALKNPTASAGFEPANLGTKGQHATSGPPKPLSVF